MNICYNFLVCESYHKTRTIPLHNWMKEQNAGNVFYFGGFENTYDDIPVLKVCDSDDYYSCIAKTEAFLKTHNPSDAYDWYFLGDDDTFVNVNLLQDKIKTLSVDEYEIHGCISYVNLKHMYGGAGIIMNSKTYKALQKFIRYKFYIFQIWSDASLGLTVIKYNKRRKEKIKLVHHEDMCYHEKHHYIEFKKLVTAHIKDRVSFEDLIKELRS